MQLAESRLQCFLYTALASTHRFSSIWLKLGEIHSSLPNKNGVAPEGTHAIAFSSVVSTAMKQCTILGTVSASDCCSCMRKNWQT